MLPIKISETEPVAGKLLIRDSLPLLPVSTEDTPNTLGIVDIALLGVDTPFEITVNP